MNINSSRYLQNGANSQLHIPYFSTSEKRVVSELYDKYGSHNRKFVAEGADGSTGKGRQLGGGGRALSGQL